MGYLPLSDHAARQLIDSITLFNESRRVQRQARQYAGGMYWKRQGAYEYLVKTQPDNRQSRIGPRSPETEKVLEEFTTRKRNMEARYKTLRDALTDAERLNKALRVGRVPALVVSVLQALEDAELGAHFTVVGTHALYAYETAAGVRIVPGALATQDVDLLWDARRRVRFMTDMQQLDTSVLKVLQRADATFVRKEGQNETAINARGFEVDFLRRQPEGDDPRFEHMVVAATGRMTLMRTIAPESFVAFKRWMASTVTTRPEPKRQRDILQAGIVQRLLDEGLLMAVQGNL
ncbi:MAG: hypothetical protein IPH35_00070 [Rhodoferax sp.]|nr:hypothetical protein [Rhodoferax sp.]